MDLFAPSLGMIVPECEAQIEQGGRYRIVMQDDDQVRYIVSGSYREVVPNQKLVLTWQWEDSPHQTLVEIEFTALSESRSSLKLRHSEFVEEEYRDKHNDGWGSCLDSLTGHLKQAAA